MVVKHWWWFIAPPQVEGSDPPGAVHGFRGSPVRASAPPQRSVASSGASGWPRDSRWALKNAQKNMENLVGFGEFMAWECVDSIGFPNLFQLFVRNCGCTYKGINNGKKLDDTWCLMMDKIKLWTIGLVNFIMTQELSQLRWIGMDNIGWNMVKHWGLQRKIWLNEALANAGFTYQQWTIGI